MMLRRQNDELHPGVLGEFDDCVRVPLIRVEPDREFGVLRAGDMSVRLNLLAVVAGELPPLPNAAEHRVEAEGLVLAIAVSAASKRAATSTAKTANKKHWSIR